MHFFRSFCSRPALAATLTFVTGFLASVDQQAIRAWLQPRESARHRPAGRMHQQALQRSRPRQIARQELERLIQRTAKRVGVHPALVRSVMKAESGGRVTAVSEKGAQGLMQLMPETAQEMGATDIQDPQQNIEAGTRYLRQLLRRYRHRKDGLKWAVAAYNAGPANVDRYRGVPPFRETRTYVDRVLTSYRELSPVMDHDGLLAVAD